MNRLISKIIFIACLYSTPLLFAQVGNVGVNTINPQQILHIDGASTVATTNPSAGMITPLQASDDVVIDTYGNLGIGRIDPVTKLDIKSLTAGAIRINDGTERLGRVLVSDADGNTEWKQMSNTWYAYLADAALPHLAAATVRKYTNYVTGYISNQLLGEANTVTGEITVPFTGMYTITFFGAMSNSRSSTAIAYVGDFQLSARSLTSTTVWESKTFGYSNFGSSFFATTSLSLDAGTVLSLSVDETLGNSASSISSGVTMQVLRTGE